jgi:hypothetical protein
MFSFSYISNNFRRSLAVRLLVLLLLVNTIASACTSDTASEEQNTVPKEQHAVIEPDTTSTRGASSSTLSVLGNPFISNRAKSNNLDNYFNQINSDFTLDADPIENRHKPTITDTIYTIRFGQSMMEFYAPTQSGDLLLQVADIKSNDISLRNNLRIGMTQVELMNRLKSLGKDIKVNQNANEVIASNREGAPVSLHFYLKSGKVSRILYEGYVD